MKKVNVNKQIVSHLIPVSILLMTIYTVLPYIKPGIPVLSSLDNTTLWWGISFLILAVFFFSRYYFFDKTNEDNMLIVWIYLLWNVVCITRGMFEAELYWDWKGLISNSMALMLPIVMFSATNKIVVQSLFVFYVKYALPLFALFALIIRTDAFGFYLMPVTVMILFFPAFTVRQRFFILLLTVAVIFSDFGARSNILKFGVPFIILAIYYLKEKISVRVIEIARVSLFIAPVLFFVLGVTHVFNVFNMNEYIKGDYVAVGTDNEGNRVEMSATADTRTFIYIEVLESAINNNYWLLGRTPARGNDSNTFGVLAAELTGRNERLANEIGLANVFTWTGVMGVVLYFLIFFRASYLAVNRSKNIYIKMLGVFIAFRWLFSWIEDVNNFTVNYFMLMIILGICFSHSFRKMTNNEIVVWARGIFDVRFIRFQYAMTKKNEYDIDLDMKPIAEENEKIIV
mgnify:FL=1